MHAHRTIFLIIAISLLFNIFPFSKDKYNSQLLYLSPVPGSKYVSKETNIIIRYKENLNFNTISKQNFKITGSKSGNHSIIIKRTDEKNTIILRPDILFAAGEVVKVSILSGFKMVSSISVLPFEFKFTISESEVKPDLSKIFPYKKELNIPKNNFQFNPGKKSPIFISDSLPPGFPPITVIVNNSSSPGNIFLSNFGFGPGQYTPYLMVLDNTGYPVKYKPPETFSFDFKVQNENTFTYYVVNKKFYSTNSDFTMLDSFNCGNGYLLDGHDLLLLPDYKAYLFGHDFQKVDMSKIVPGGNPNATVMGMVIQEIDEYKSVIFQWRSFDHFKITDATHENLQDSLIDYVHANSIDLDYDGNILISCRHMDEITKINRQTGDIMWRLGGKNNQFTFINDTIGFSHQHAFRRISNGHYTLFDNGNYHNPPFSRAIEYNLDQVNKTSTLVWQFRHGDTVFANAMGYTQRLPNGNTIIGWGSTNPNVTEVNPEGNIVYELTFPLGVISYRAYRLTWTGGAQKPFPKFFTLYQNSPNPFNPITTIKYDISESGHVNLVVYDILGKLVKTLVSRNQDKGFYTISFNATNLASGVYFYKLDVNGYSKTKKMTLIK